MPAIARGWNFSAVPTKKKKLIWTARNLVEIACTCLRAMARYGVMRRAEARITPKKSLVTETPSQTVNSAASTVMAVSLIVEVVFEFEFVGVFFFNRENFPTSRTKYGFRGWSDAAKDYAFNDRIS